MRYVVLSLVLLVMAAPVAAQPTSPEAAPGMVGLVIDETLPVHENRPRPSVLFPFVVRDPDVSVSLEAGQAVWALEVAKVRDDLGEEPSRWFLVETRDGTRGWVNSTESIVWLPLSLGLGPEHYGSILDAARDYFTHLRNSIDDPEIKERTEAALATIDRAHQ